MNPKSQQPMVTVIMSVYNQAPYVSEAIDSVLAQDYPNFELIVVNDCSQDNSAEILDAYAQKDSRVRVIHNPMNYGQVTSQNSAIAAGRGTYIANLDGDNVWLATDKLSKQVAWIEEHPEYVLVGGGVQLIDPKGKRTDIKHSTHTDEEIRQGMLMTCEFGASSVLYPRALAMKLGGYSDDRKYARDLGLWLAMGLHGKMTNLPFVWHGHRMTGMNIGELHRKEQLQDALYHITQYRHEYPHFQKARIYHVLMILLFSLPMPVINALRKIKRLWKR